MEDNRILILIERINEHEEKINELVKSIDGFENCINSMNWLAKELIKVKLNNINN